jgi:hypothetical protein
MIDIILVAVTAISLAIASVMGVITWRVLRQERQRFTGRVADLSAAANAEPDERDADVAPAPREAVPVMRRTPEIEPDRAAAAATDDVAAPLWTDLVLARTADAPRPARPTVMPDLFVAQEPMRSTGRRFTLAVALGSAMLLVVFAIVLALNAKPSAQASPAAARVASPLELVVLDHARLGGRLSIHGLVRNPSTGSAIRQLSAVVFLFDRDGGYLGTAQAPVLERDLAPGGESSFEVPVETGQRVARYRLTFRVAAAPVPHVDRRAAVPPAAPARAAVVAAASLDGSSAGRR